MGETKRSEEEEEEVRADRQDNGGNAKNMLRDKNSGENLLVGICDMTFTLSWMPGSATALKGVACQ